MRFSAATLADQDENVVAEVVPAYDLGYLLRRLPRPTGIYADWPAQLYSAEYQHADHLDDERMHVHDMDTPEDAACILAIELFKQGILSKDW